MKRAGVVLRSFGVALLDVLHPPVPRWMARFVPRFLLAGDRERRLFGRARSAVAGSAADGSAGVEGERSDDERR